MRVALQALLLAILLPSAAWAGDSPSFAAQMLRVAAGLTFVLGLMAAMFAFYRSRSRLSGQPGGQRLLDVVEARQLGARRAVAIVRAGESHFLVGCGDDGIRLIAPVSLAPAAIEPPRLPLAIPRELLGLAMNLRSALSRNQGGEMAVCPRCSHSMSGDGEEFTCGSCRGVFHKVQRNEG